MTYGPIIAWLTRRAFSHPAGWLFCLCCSALPLLISALGPLGVGSIFTRSSGVLYECAFLSALFGTLWAARRVEEIEVQLRRIAFSRALTIEAVILVFGSLGCASIVLAPVLFLMPTTSIGSGTGWGLVLVAFHLAASMLVLRRMRMTGEVRSIVLVTLAWVFPSMAVRSSGLVGNLKTLLGTTQDLELGATPVPWTVAIAPIIALVLVSMSLDLLRRSTP